MPGEGTHVSSACADNETTYMSAVPWSPKGTLICTAHACCVYGYDSM